jgi:tetratricopeptide (TPR) repeat protein/tRNA A-37 threonylcarbamoyl transferase component Bud32
VIATNCPSAAELAALVEGLLSGDALERVAAHVDACPSCLAAAQQVRPGDTQVALLCLDTLPDGRFPAGPEGRYVAVQLHAAGGLGEVHVAEDTELRRKVALKRIRPARADDPDSRRRFLREAEITARLEHPGIVPVYGLVRDSEGRPHYAMRFIAGRTLHEAIRAFHAADWPGRDPGERALALRALLSRFVAVCQTVAYAHSKGVVHRDLKPANVMLGEFGETLVVDWGLAKEMPGAERGAQNADTGSIDSASSPDSQPRDPHSADETLPGQVVGTPAYMSPEQAAGRHDEVTPASDVYLLGGTLYTILTGRPPFDGDTAVSPSSAARAPVPPRQVSASVPAALSAVCLKALAARPADRYPSAAEVGAEVEKWLGGAAVAAHPERWPARAVRWARRHRVAVGGLAVGLVVAAVLGSGGGVWLAREAADRRSERARLEAKDADAIDRALAEIPRLVRTARFREAVGLLEQTAAGLSEFVPAEARDRLDRARAEARLAERLDTIWLETSVAEGGKWSKADVAPVYLDVFSQYGLRCFQGDVTALAERVAASPVRETLLVALDDWAGKEQDPARRERLTLITRAADPDPVRDPFRDALARRDGATAWKLAREVEVERLTPIHLIGLARYGGLKTPEAERLLRRAQNRYPTDFWINYYTAIAVDRAYDRVAAAQAVGFYRACLVARPDVSIVHATLGSTLVTLEDWPGAEAACRRAIELDRNFAYAHATLGLILKAQGNMTGAEAAFRRALEINPDSAFAHGGIGAILEVRGDLKGAEAALRRAVEFDPNYAEAFALLGDVLRDRGDESGAESAFRRVLELLPNHAATHAALGNLLLKRGDLDGAAASFRLALELTPNRTGARVNLAHVLQRRGDLDGAAEMLRQAAALDPGSAMVHNNLGNVLREQGNFGGAEVALRRALELDPNLAACHASRGGLLEKLGDLAGAAAAYRRALELDPNLVVAHVNLGNVLVRQGNLAGAEAAYRRAIAVDPAFQPAYINLGKVLLERGDKPGAETACRRAVELDPTSALAYTILGNVLREEGNLAGAEAAYRRAIELDPNAPAGHNNLGNLLYDRGDWAQAEAAFRRALKLDPYYLAAHINLGNLLRVREDLAAAEPFLRRAVALAPNYAQAHFNLALLLFDRGDLSGAEIAYQRAAELDKKYLEPHVWLTILLLKLGRFDEARASAQRVLDMLPPRHPRRNQAVERLRRCELMAQLDRKLPDVLRGEAPPADPAEHLVLAEVATIRKRYTGAARLYEELFRKAPPAESAGDYRRYPAARVAALAGCGQGADDPTSNAAERVRLRRQSLDWLRAELKGRAASLEATDPRAKEAARAALRRWQTDPDLAGVRDAAGLAALPADEQDAWRQFWADVAGAIAPSRK